jgi:hypothetical protein
VHWRITAKWYALCICSEHTRGMLISSSFMKRTASIAGLFLLSLVAANGGYAQTQENSNSAVAMPTNSQQNQSRSESIGGGIYNYQINPAQGELGEMTVGSRAISCQSPSFFANVGVLPYDNQYFGTFGDNNRDKDWMPQGTIGFQMPFGPQVSSCISAMKNQAKQTMMTTESGILKKCVEAKVIATKGEIQLASLKSTLPGLYNHCKTMWNLGTTSSSNINSTLSEQ